MEGVSLNSLRPHEARVFPEMPQGSAEAKTVRSVEASQAEEAAAKNRGERERFFATVGAMEGLSPRFLGYVQDRLGLSGHVEVSATPLEEREIQEILSDAERQVAANVLQVTEVVCEAVSREFEDAFEKDENASFGDVLAELETILPGEQLPQASQIAFLVFRKELMTHLREMRELLIVEGMRQNRPNEMGAAFSQYARTALSLARRAAVEPEFDPFELFATSALLQSVILVDIVVKIVEIVVRLRVEIIKYRLAKKTISSREKAAISQQKIRELVERIKEAFLELDARLKELMAILQKREESASAVVQVLQNVAAKRLERLHREWTKEVAGFEVRQERLREDAREETEEVSFERMVAGSRA